MEAFLPIVFVLVFAAVIALGVWSYFQDQKRQAALVAWAQANHLSFSPEEDESLEDRFREFSCLQEGQKRYGYNIFEGTYGKRPMTAFDYHYETHSTDSKGNRETTHHHFSAVVVEAGVPLKPLYIRSENFFDKVGEFLGLDDIDFESAEFSREFHVTAPDRRWAFDVLHQQAMEMLLAAPRFTLEFQGRRVMATRGSCFSAEEFAAGLDVVNQLLNLLPNSVLRELSENN